MVPLPLFKLAALFVRHVSKYGANRIKHQAHDHPRFRQFAARYGQMIHQLNMRASVALKRDPEAEARAREKAEAPTVKTEEQVKREALQSEHRMAGKDTTHSIGTSPWKRKFRALPEAKAVDLFADVIGDTFILAVAVALVIYEYYRSSQKPDHNAERLKELDKKLEELKLREEELAAAEEKAEARVKLIEEALRAFRDPKTNEPLLPTPPLSA